MVRRISSIICKTIDNSNTMNHLPGTIGVWNNVTFWDTTCLISPSKPRKLHADFIL